MQRTPSRTLIGVMLLALTAIAVIVFVAWNRIAGERERIREATTSSWHGPGPERTGSPSRPGRRHFADVALPGSSTRLPARGRRSKIL